MYLSDSLKTEKGHSHIDYVDFNTAKDSKLFIDPCLIEIAQDELGKQLHTVIKNYFDKFYDLYKSDSLPEEKYELFKHSHEINAPKLGYGNGYNGKAKTPEGMMEMFVNLPDLLTSNKCINHPMDLPLFIHKFAENCLSDLITNITFLCLNNYTIHHLHLPISIAVAISDVNISITNIISKLELLYLFYLYPFSPLISRDLFNKELIAFLYSCSFFDSSLHHDAL